MNTLTSIEDVDINIISSLSLIDVRSVCRSSKYTADLCKKSILLRNKLQKAQKKADKILYIINSREYGIKLQMSNENQPCYPFIDIMEYI